MADLVRSWQSGFVSRRVVGPDGLEWRIRRLILPGWMRPIGLWAAAAPYYETTSLSAPRGGSGYAGPAIVFGLLWCLLALPLLPLVLLLRKLGFSAWTVEAHARPWGRRGPPMVLLYQVTGRENAEVVLRGLAAALERGEGAPVIPGAERISS